MTNKEKILSQVCDFFITSNDFNGIPITTLSKNTEIEYSETIDILKELTKEGLVSNQKTINPHIIALGHFEESYQLSVLEDAKNNKTEKIQSFGNINITFDSHLICVYPSEKHLKETRDTSSFSQKPYSKRLALGEPQLKAAFFEIEVLDNYFKDPRYSFDFEDYSGQICCDYDENQQPLLPKEEDQIFLKTFGLGVNENKERVAVVYLSYLSNLTSEHQLYWKSKEIDSGCKILKEYYTNTIEGNWTTSYSIFSAFIEEHRLINEVSNTFSTESLFNKTFENEKRPKEFTFFFMPTLENYHKFISLLDKMLSDNINRKFFDGKIELYELEELSSGQVERKNKGTLRLLEEWIRENYNHPENKLFIDIFKPIKKVRKERQSPAHKISDNHYDKKLNKKQIELLVEVYKSLKLLRMIFEQHPESNKIEIPEWLIEGNIKIF
ncbi:hypothetical protein [Tenacibaculum piscium]|uniref:hypothetical protein n=1 Tax=Tenacibaculum piscium TaxID=1458515 RepID=UPI001F3360F3|nr:hypothetical protein [Tenacibaculum piscium]